MGWRRPSSLYGSLGNQFCAIPNNDDLRLETVRTNDFLSPLSTARRDFIAKPTTVSDSDTWSDFTDVTTGLSSLPSELIARRDDSSSVGSFNATLVNSPQLNGSSPGGPQVSKMTTNGLSHGSYVVERNFRDEDSARAAGYPVISEDPFNVSSLSVL